MAAKKPAKKGARKSANGTTTAGAASKGFTKDERTAMRERAQELKAEARRLRQAGEASDEGAVLEKLAGMPASDRAMGERIHAIIRANAPNLTPRLWYGMPAYSRNDGVACFFQGAHKFKTRYATIGFTDKSSLDDGRMWPTVFALKELTAAEEERIIALVKRAAS